MHHPFLFPLQILYFQMYYPCSMNKVPLPSGTSIGTKKRRATEKKNATIRQHYYPEVAFWTNWTSIQTIIITSFQGGWGWLVLVCALVANLLGHGLQLSYGVRPLIFNECFHLIVAPWMCSISDCCTRSPWWQYVEDGAGQATGQPVRNFAVFFDVKKTMKILAEKGG